MKNAMVSVVYMFFITFVFTFMVSAVKLINEKQIQLNETIKIQKIVLKVLDIFPTDNTDEEIRQLYQSRIKVKMFTGRKFYIAYENDGQTIRSYAFTVGGSGFWGPIEAMVAVDPNVSYLKGISFFKHTETPGLGARITEDWFTKQFVGLDLHPVSDGNKMFYLKPVGSKKEKKDLDAITGATGTSRAVEKFLNAGLDLLLREFDPHGQTVPKG